jgi:uncharacterized damage-inducible protein DinB
VAENIFKLLVKYNKEINQEMNNIIKTLTDEEWNRRFSGYYKSIHELCSHIFIWDYIWLSRLKSAGNFSSLNGSYFNREYNFRELLFENIDEYLAKRPELDDVLINFVNEITADILTKEAKWTDSEGAQCREKVEMILIHVSNHQTHHRGMISLYLESLGKENDYSR